MRPGKFINNGKKIMYMTVARVLHTQVLDIQNFSPMKLVALLKTVGLTALKKRWFPHYFNRKENQDYVGSYPTPESYDYYFMETEEHSEFLKRLESVEGQQFDFRKAMKEYCVSDVDNFRQACLKFQRLLIISTLTCALFTTKKKGNKK